MERIQVVGELYGDLRVNEAKRSEGRFEKSGSIFRKCWKANESCGNIKNVETKDGQ